MRPSDSRCTYNVTAKNNVLLWPRRDENMQAGELKETRHPQPAFSNTSMSFVAGVKGDLNLKAHRLR